MAQVDSMKITVLSAGTWGITLAALLEGKGHAVRVWEFSPEVVRTLSETRRHPKLPEFEVPAGLMLTTDMAQALEGAQAVVCVVPAAHMRTTCRVLADSGYAGQPVVICTKGIEKDSLVLMTDVAHQELGPAATERLAVLTGPSHAEEVSRGLPTVVSAVAEDPRLAEQIQQMFITPRFRVYSHTDIRGVELGGALKNVIAIACGISDGLGNGDNAKAALITRGLHEILRLGVALGALPETFFGLTGLGDLVVTAMSRHSRNWKFGSLVGSGVPPQEALEQVGMVVEGHYTVQATVALARREGVEMPISEAVHQVLFEGLPPADGVAALMMRQPKSETAR